MAPFISNIPQNDIGSYLDLYIRLSSESQLDSDGKQRWAEAASVAPSILGHEQEGDELEAALRANRPGAPMPWKGSWLSSG